MERITSNQVLGLMEAYTAVHTPQINEEQIQEDFEIWVNSLVEEGYDLSEYTWEEMYEEYITEIGVNFGGQKAVDAVKAKSAQQQQSNAKLDAARTQRFGGTRPSGATSRSQLAGGTPTTAKPAPAAQGQKYKSSSDGKMYKNYNDALAAKNSRMGSLGVQQGLQKTFKAGGGNAAVAQGKNPLSVMAQGSTNLQRQQRPAAPAPGGATPRPAAPAPSAAKPAAAPAGGAQRPIPSGTTVPVRPATPAAAPARNGFGASTAPMAAQSSVSSATAPAAAPAKKPSIASGINDIKAMQAASRQRQGLTQSFDVFDVIKGYLIDEGYADTEEAALQIMANMSEEWRQSIVEGLDSV
jgi:hypothetical protein